MFKIIFLIPLLLLACSKKQTQIAEQTEEAEEVKTAEAEKPKIYGFELCFNHIKNLDTTSYKLCCEENNACWHEEDSLTRISFPRLIPGGKKEFFKCGTTSGVQYWLKHCKPKGIDMPDCPCPVE